MNFTHAELSRKELAYPTQRQLDNMRPVTGYYPAEGRRTQLERKKEIREKDLV